MKKLIKALLNINLFIKAIIPAIRFTWSKPNFFIRNLGGMNKLFFETINLEKEFSRAAKEKESLFVSIIEVNGLKIINNKLGNREGDIYLKIFEEFMINSLRKDDIFIIWGGDEYVVILLGKEEELQEIMKSFQEKCPVGFIYGIHSINNTQEKPLCRKDFDKALHNAYQEMYKQKKGGNKNG
jgi:diguanylate cyclase (GGDEF)-like protein